LDFGGIAVRVISLHNPDLIEPLLRRNVLLHLYALGDLDPFFWPFTTWYALEDEGRLHALVLLYTVTNPPTLLAYSEPPWEPMQQLLRWCQGMVPARVYGHVMPECLAALEPSYAVQSHGRFLKMGLMERTVLEHVDTGSVDRLTGEHLDEIRKLYAVSYPGNWFDARMLETGFYFGLRREGRLVSIAGVHVISPAKKVAALGNIATHPDWRGRGLGTLVTARLCQELLPVVDHIGLNVKASNAAAVACYEKLGFRPVVEYEECWIEWKGT
jgi:ribosomal protein S18 acetylase RimI-like enzyme